MIRFVFWEANAMDAVECRPEEGKLGGKGPGEGLLLICPVHLE